MSTCSTCKHWDPNGLDCLKDSRGRPCGFCSHPWVTCEVIEDATGGNGTYCITTSDDATCAYHEPR